MRKYVVTTSKGCAQFDTYRFAENHARLNSGTVWMGSDVSRIDENGHAHLFATARPIYY